LGLDELMDKLKETGKLQEFAEELAEEIPGPQGTAVDGPAHYNGYQVLEAICDAGLGRGFCLGNAIKYLLRSGKKGKHKEDLDKAQFYLNWYLERYEEYEESK